MATLNAGLIQTAIRNALESASGVSRAIASNTYDGGVYETQPAEEKSRLGVVRPRIEPVMRSITPSRVAPPRNGSLGIYEFEVDVMVYRHLDSAHKITSATRDAAVAAALSDGDVIAQCLEFPGNVNVNSGGTSVIGQCVRFIGSSIENIDLADSGPGLITTKHRFAGFAQVNQA
jgi:hypothetical protein